MKRSVLALVVTMVAATGLPAAAQTTDCEPARCAAQTAINDRCACSTAGNHGKYVSCVARVVNKLAKDGTIPKNCKGKIRRCAARSTCGKPGAVTCLIPVYGTCDLTTGTCTSGTSATGTCASNTDCLVGTRCKTKSSADRCTAAGGTVGTSSTCCADCVAPPAP